MAIRKILTEESELLYKKSRIVENFDEKLSILIDDMFETMNKANGVGLAAPQVGILRRVIVIKIGNESIELVNPKIEQHMGKQTEEEGCLSCPNFFGVTLRPMFVVVSGYNRSGKAVKYSAKGLKARAFCHEIDHLDGILFKSRLVSKIKN